MEEKIRLNRSIYSQDEKKQFICSCGKKYLSNAALHTHVKTKHDGKPPGPVTKPSYMKGKRGRPSKKQNQNNESANSNTFSSSNQVSSVSVQNDEIAQDDKFYLQNLTDKKQPKPEQTETQQQKIYRNAKLEDLVNQAIQYISSCFGSSENFSIALNKQHLGQVQAFAQMVVYISKKQSQQLDQEITHSSFKEKEKEVELGNGLYTYLRQLSLGLNWFYFEEVFVFYMLFLQYLMDEFNDKSLLEKAPMRILQNFGDQFLEKHLYPMAEYYKLEQMKLLQFGKPQILLKLLFEWMLFKNYGSRKADGKMVSAFQRNKQLCFFHTKCLKSTPEFIKNYIIKQ